MLTKKQIKAQIKKLRERRKELSILPGTYRLKAQLHFRYAEHVLARVLEYKEPVWYFCTGCLVPHPNTKCPICGDDEVFPKHQWQTFLKEHGKEG